VLTNKVKRIIKRNDNINISAKGFVSKILTKRQEKGLYQKPARYSGSYW
jgi:hypothetical protein